MSDQDIFLLFSFVVAILAVIWLWPKVWLAGSFGVEAVRYYSRSNLILALHSSRTCHCSTNSVPSRLGVIRSGNTGFSHGTVSLGSGGATIAVGAAQLVSKSSGQHSVETTSRIGHSVETVF